ncbi:hypothetical protein PVK06_008675 [Gossypium arboreum]|uniref:DUF4283 domain-containing protein n=1 Tax=Gossypium arboreum TaxID=29729 RepID=A0ABR0QKR7_GOSAR|nr:hypothetical protein PVK06_008675 [Gossypium arboreum]
MSGTLPTMDFAASANNSTSTNGIGRAMNKVHTRPKVKLDFDNPTMDNNDHRIQSEISKASYKSTLLRASSKKNNGGFLEEEFTLLDGEAVTEVMEGVPSITFSNRVYLILRPWSLEFSTSQSGIESQVVWIRLPGLTEGYYSDCLLRVIGQMVGPVVKLDVYMDCVAGDDLHD